MDAVASCFSCHPILIPNAGLATLLSNWREASSSLGRASDVFGQTGICSGRYYRSLFEHHSDLDIMLRSLLLVHTNDMLLALQPLVTPTSGDEIICDSHSSLADSCSVTTTAESNYPVHWLVSSMKGYLFNQVRCNIYIYICVLEYI